MADLNDELLDGIDELDCSENMNKFLKNILNYELKLYKEKGTTQKTIADEYDKLIMELSNEG